MYMGMYVGMHVHRKLVLEWAFFFDPPVGSLN